MVSQTIAFKNSVWHVKLILLCFWNIFLLIYSTSSGKTEDIVNSSGSRGRRSGPVQVVGVEAVAEAQEGELRQHGGQHGPLAALQLLERHQAAVGVVDAHLVQLGPAQLGGRLAAQQTRA